jgi:hypothetical protein
MFYSNERLPISCAVGTRRAGNFKSVMNLDMPVYQSHDRSSGKIPYEAK